MRILNTRRIFRGENKHRYFGFFVGVVLLVGTAGKEPFVSLEIGTVAQQQEGSVFQSKEGAQELSPVEKNMQRAGFVEITALDTSIRVKLIYATADNFTGKLLYRELKKAYLHPIAAAKLKKAQHILKVQRPGCSLIVYDAARPMSVQREMWEQVKGTEFSIYVANPKTGGGLHNYGMAVDVSLVDSSGREVDMGCAVDYFGEKARVDREEALLSAGKLSREAGENRRLLRKVMTDAGFISLRSEWWHFNALPSKEVVGKMNLIE